jgi:hypothetical protein
MLNIEIIEQEEVKQKEEKEENQQNQQIPIQEDTMMSPLKLISALNANPNAMRTCIFEIKKILSKFPPAKNENKFIYGKLGERSLNKAFSTFSVCEDLDASHVSGSEYKNDCKIIDTCYSIKISKNGGAVTLINKNNKSEHIIDHNFIICHIEKKKLYIFPSSIIPEKFIKDSGPKIDYKPALFKYMDETTPQHVYSFPELTEEQENKLREEKEINIYELLYKKYVEEEDEVTNKYAKEQEEEEEDNGKEDGV